MSRRGPRKILDPTGQGGCSPSDHYLLPLLNALDEVRDNAKGATPQRPLLASHAAAPSPQYVVLAAGLEYSYSHEGCVSSATWI